VYVVTLDLPAVNTRCTCRRFRGTTPCTCNFTVAPTTPHVAHTAVPTTRLCLPPAFPYRCNFPHLQHYHAYIPTTSCNHAYHFILTAHQLPGRLPVYSGRLILLPTAFVPLPKTNVGRGGWWNRATGLRDFRRWILHLVGAPLVAFAPRTTPRTDIYCYLCHFLPCCC